VHSEGTFHQDGGTGAAECEVERLAVHASSRVAAVKRMGLVLQKHEGD
jgi:hypothetical protein